MPQNSADSKKKSVQSAKSAEVSSLRASVPLRLKSFFKCCHKVIVALTVQKILDEHIARKLVWTSLRILQPINPISRPQGLVIAIAGCKIAPRRH
jgi:hypothetical protein